MKMKIRSVLLMLGSVAMLYVLAATGKAQTSGEITGLVTDSSGATVSGANVTVTNEKLNSRLRLNRGVESFRGSYTDQLCLTRWSLHAFCGD